MGPVGLCDLLPHHCVEAWAGLVAKHEASVVIVSVCVDEECSTEVHRIELIITWTGMKDGLVSMANSCDAFCQLPCADATRTMAIIILTGLLVESVLHTDSNARIAVDGLHQLLALMTDHPVGVDLRGARGVQRNHLEPAEVCFADGKVFWADIVDIQYVVLVKVVFAHIPAAIPWKKENKSHTLNWNQTSEYD